MHDGVIQDFSIAENIILQDHVRKPFSKGVFLDFKAIAKRSQQLVDEFRVKTPSIDTPIKSLSGGNIQKVILAREISNAPKVLIAAQPTRGVDIGATEYIHQRLLDQRASRGGRGITKFPVKAIPDEALLKIAVVDQRHLSLIHISEPTRPY